LQAERIRERRMRLMIKKDVRFFIGFAFNN